MIKVDISNIWGQVALPALLGVERTVSQAHSTLMEGTGPGSDCRGWLDLPTERPTEEMLRIQAAADRIRKSSDVLVVIGIGGSCLGSQAAIELLQGPNRNLGRGKGDPMILYAGNSLSTQAWQELQRLLEGKDVSVCVISKSGTTTEPAIATRALRWILERKYGSEEARKRTYAITDPCDGALRQMAQEGGWESFVIPKTVGGRYSVLTAAGLLPMAVAGLDIRAVMAGAWEAKQELDLRSFENPVWLYAGVRHLLHSRGKDIELLASFEPGFRSMGAWWQQLFAQSEGKDGKGLFPVPVEFTADLHALGQLIQQGKRSLFETVLRFEAPEHKVRVGGDVNDLDGLNYLEGKSLDFVEHQAYLGTLEAHTDGGVPVITVEAGPLCEKTLGELLYFFQLACGVSAYALGVNPFDQPGVEACKANMLALLGKP